MTKFRPNFVFPRLNAAAVAKQPLVLFSILFKFQRDHSDPYLEDNIYLLNDRKILLFVTLLEPTRKRKKA